MTDLDKLLELDEACQLVLDGKVQPATLTAAYKRGELTLEKLGRKYFVTRRYIEEWRGQCRLRQNRPVSGSDRQEASAERRGSSSTPESKSPHDVTRTTLKALKERLRSTSQPSTAREVRGIRAVSP